MKAHLLFNTQRNAKSFSGLPGHVFINVNFTEILLGFGVIETNCPNPAAQQQLETKHEGEKWKVRN